MPTACDLVAIDLDGTLLRADGTVSPGNRAALGRAKAEGLVIVIATGRSWVECSAILKSIDHDGWSVTAGGSILNDAVTGRTVMRDAMDPGLVRDATAPLLEDGHKVLLLKDGDQTGYDYLAVGPHDYDRASQWWFERLPARVREVSHVDEDEHPHDTLRVGAVASSSQLEPLAAHLRGVLGSRALIQHWSAVTESAATGSSTHLLEVFQPDVDKWTMLRRLCVRLSIDPVRTAAIGDGLNDVGMIRGAGIGYAVPHADPRVIAVADHVIQADDEGDAVASAIDELLRVRRGQRRADAAGNTSVEVSP